MDTAVTRLRWLVVSLLVAMSAGVAVRQASATPVSPHHRWMAVAMTPPLGHHTAIFKVRTNGAGGPVQVSHPALLMAGTHGLIGVDDSQPEWSPVDGTIAFVRNIFEGYNSTQQLVTVVGGVETVRVGWPADVYEHWFSAPPVWGADGRSLYFTDAWSPMTSVSW